MSTTAKNLGSFIADAPPGEINEVYADIITLIENNPSIVKALEPHIEKFNLENFTIVNLSSDSSAVISKYNQIGDGEFYDSTSGKSFSFNHISRKVSNVSNYSPETSFDVASLNVSLGNYVLEHFPSNSSYGVFPQPDGTIVLVIVDNKFNPSNFWNGQWKSFYILNPSSGEVSGRVDLDAHYYEDGNVRLKSSHDINFSISDSSDTKSLVKKISFEESKYQQEVNKSFVELNESSFKSLRRQLPVTRSKINWGKSIGTYRLGKDITNSRA
ncbi:F-actin capping protein alpha subunit [Nadsonia fulvescens var. elongata DSM 6958]|uniref:F-actin-capping protein subunit alpha n=1 Tax=Nadsonia fulvescens var. elongata DSM 6958 TaxID=857566 RepID=A0A1E3PGJ9_9ASCO|nr:F-actin capping protein alpha subunit [Nadsonia fulvescens var. elongata DSM 6958]